MIVAGFFFRHGPQLAKNVKAFARRIAAERGVGFVDLAAATIRNVARGVIGVAPPAFRGTVAALRYDLWTPVTMSADLGFGAGVLQDRGNRGLDVLLRLAAGAGIAQVHAEASALAHKIAATYPDTNRNFGVRLVPV